MHEWEEEEFDEWEDDEDYGEDEDDVDDSDNSGRITVNLPRPHEGQQKVLDSKARYKVLCCGRRWGKTQICQIIAIKAMLNQESVAYVLPVFKDGTDFFRDLKKLLPEKLIRVMNMSELYLELVTGGTLQFFSGESLDSFRGKKFHKVIIDEAAKLNDLEKSWYAAIRPTLTDYRGEAIFISTPRGMNFFYKIFLKGQEKQDSFESWHYPTSANPYLPEGEFEEAERTYPAAEFRQEYLAIPMSNSFNPFGDNIDRNTIDTLSTKPPVIIGIDLAAHVDWTVVIGLDEDGATCYFDRFQLNSFEFTHDRLAKLPNDVLKVVDSTGNGGPMAERLATVLPHVKAFNFSGQKAKLVIALAESLEKDRIKVNRQTAYELNNFERKQNPTTGKVTFQGQKGEHDDCVMALALANLHLQYSISAQNWTLYTI